MKLRIQFGAWLLAATSCAGLSLPCYAQRPRIAAEQRQEKRQEHQQQRQTNQNQQKQNLNANRPPANANRPADRPPSQPLPGERPHANGGTVRPRNERGNRTPRQQLGVGVPRPWVDQMRSLSPQQRDRVLQNSRAFQNLAPEQQNRIRQQLGQWDRMSPQQRADQQAKEDAWRRMTPEQREHIKTDVLPKWRQLPWGRQQAIQQRLRVLQNMPESARNQRLNDPKFTEGMNEEDKATLHDLSHLHVGGAPDPPSE